MKRSTSYPKLDSGADETRVLVGYEPKTWFTGIFYWTWRAFVRVVKASRVDASGDGSELSWPETIQWRAESAGGWPEYPIGWATSTEPATTTSSEWWSEDPAQVWFEAAKHECWDVVGGTAVANPNDPQWTERNQFARYALLFDMLPKDSKKICRMATAREMWNSFEQDKTKRAYASEIRLRRDLYAAKFTVGEDMEKYLERLEDMRRQLANMNAAIKPYCTSNDWPTPIWTPTSSKQLVQPKHLGDGGDVDAVHADRCRQ
ncbi:hypothetical protein ON010_g4665 [Phytophthora cinnamomi]|nr:hypothetical protein ON010_g4665 [Phytophthora cinnamomi]